LIPTAAGLVNAHAPIVPPHTSVPGILLSQYGAYRDLAVRPTATIGHSQGVLAAAMVESSEPASIFALARLIGAAASKVSGELGITASKDASPMLSVRGVG
ncbi:hypothetical protein R6G99_11420, partial [Actinotignum timonense]|nr:hypothetical protein [Actinotignum timonense]